mmetsp:Transcript_24353/g.43370  ORF Transcript_24353/g.43370 Transcript_24353/m.43370 type:complete len:232 (-) Transcript_24353:91-786(-)|eukprot:CAMPEP_0177758248 /NCGR_PEP_ID=MMETSP0491_2-20121128/4085_1 /TAXON_ID=63592 /ORGANISM="Tetraselmis chuii, Strain PLY429" /LENGTH=231 /DNA_ID=CAMNT_0019273973 /DNA_START=194 /DNA_END=892 /DNA_ORIENTATION=-
MSWGKPAEKPKSSSGLSKETQSFIDGLINNKNVSRRAATDIHEAVGRGDSNWVNTLNKGVASRKPTGHLEKAHRPKVSTPKVGNSSRYAPPALPTGTFSGKRMQSHIEASSPYDREQYQTRVPGPDREKEKDRLARRLEMGREAAMKLEAVEMDLANRMRRGELVRATQPVKTGEENAREQLIDQILDEIEERRVFLEEMRSKGQSQQYEAQMKGEIAERLAQLRRMGVTS